MKFLLVPDSFKGSMSAQKVCKVWTEEISKAFPDAEIKAFPACDGGEGTVENLSSILGGKKINITATDGNFERKKASYAIVNKTAYIAVANTSGLPETKIKDPKLTTTLGFGEQIKDAIGRGCDEVVLSLGGSSTNDGGAGASCALGARFYDKEEAFVPTGGSLDKIDRIDLNAFDKSIENVRFLGLCDVKNPLTGKDGCSYVYAKQKGAESAESRDELEKNMLAYAEKTAFLNVPKETEGAGAAGGLGYFVKAFLKGKLISGADYFLDLIKFDEECADADYILCGEGKFDATSDSGKICGKIIERAVKHGKKTTVFCGIAEKTDGEDVSVYEISDKTKPLSYNMTNAVRNLRRTAKRFLSSIK